MVQRIPTHNLGSTWERTLEACNNTYLNTYMYLGTLHIALTKNTICMLPVASDHRSGDNDFGS